MTNDIVATARELHEMRRRMAGKNRDRHPEAPSGEVVALGAQTYAVLSNSTGETVAVYQVSGPTTSLQLMHVELSDWRTLTETYRRRAEDVYGAVRP
jgi:hypothetical protein